MDEIQRNFSTIRWAYAEQDPVALHELEKRIATAGRAEDVLTYSELVKDVPFNLSSLRNVPRTINVSDWHEIDRAIVGDFLGYISMRSYDRGRFFASALVVSKETSEPGDGFGALLEHLGLVGSAKSPKVEAIWVDHINKAIAWFRDNEQPVEAR